MTTWDNLLSGYNWYSGFVGDHPSPISEIWESRILVRYITDLLANSANLIKLSVQVVVFLLIFLIFLAVLVNVFAPVIRRLGQW